MNNFEKNFNKHFSELTKIISTENGDWIVKGFIDVYKKVYTISSDTKVISKLIELMIFPELQAFAMSNNYKMVLSKEQNHYPDITFILDNGDKIAVDLKSTYRRSSTEINGMTLGAFTGYFRNRTSSKNITFPYGEYKKHYVLGIIYTRQIEVLNECKTFKIDDLQTIFSVAKEFEFFLQEKYKIAIDRPGSGNTKNIGSSNKIKVLKNGTATFSKLGVDIFDDYWMNYLTNDMAQKIETRTPYKNLKEYLKYRKKTKELKLP
ncbi:MAG: EcoRV family type II restriction endonuclease [Elusimicrobia bacterium]|nr:EcoRV family type II restriction endonuclease [Elusimicrobiota bacterium]